MNEPRNGARGPDDRVTRRKILAAGFNLAPRRAVYALPPGVPALQSESAEEEPGIDTIARRTESEIELMLRGAQTIAEGPLDALVQHCDLFVDLFANHARDDARMIHGLDRLGQLALLDGSQRGVQISRRILDAFDTAECPPVLQRTLVNLYTLVGRESQ